MKSADNAQEGICRIRYREGFHYTLAERFKMRTPIIPAKKIVTRFLTLNESGTLVIEPDYSWNGGTGAVDDSVMIYASLVHDAFYQLMRMGFVAIEQKELADKLLHDMIVDGYKYKLSGVNKPVAYALERFAFFRAWYVKRAVATLGDRFASPKGYEDEVKIAP